MTPYEEIMNCDTLKGEFIRACQRYNNHVDFYNQLYERIVTTTYNSRVKNITTEYKFWRVGRYASGSMDVAFRGNLKANQKSVCEYAQQDLKQKINNVDDKSK